MSTAEVAVQLIDDIPQRTVDSTLELLRSKLLEDKAKLVKVLIADYRYLYLVGNEVAGYYFVEQEGKVVYFAKYTQHFLGHLSGTYQMLVWRDKTAPTFGLVQKVLLEYLLPKFGRVFSDSKQTQDGAHFWFVMLQKVLEKKQAFVYIWDGASLIAIQTLEELASVHNKVWGPTLTHSKIRVVLAKKEVEHE